MHWTFAITVLSIIGVVANNLQKRWCFILWFYTNLAWCIYDWTIGAYSQSLLFAVYVVLAVHGWQSWGEAGVRYNFPKTRFVDENTSLQQIIAIEQEYIEFKESDCGTRHEIEEAVDLYHSLETYFRILENCGVDISKVFEEVKLKNEKRGYYELRSDSRCRRIRKSNSK